VSYIALLSIVTPTHIQIYKLYKWKP
jgi:hypothetical protein